MKHIYRGVPQSILTELGFELDREHPAIAHFARVNGISTNTVRALVDNIIEMCEERGVSPSTGAVIDALGIVTAFHCTGEELRTGAT